MDDLSKIREKISSIDHDLISLLSERLKMAEDIAVYKKCNNLPIYQPDRETQMLLHYRKLASVKNIDPDFIENIFNLIIREMRKNQSS